MGEILKNKRENKRPFILMFLFEHFFKSFFFVLKVIYTTT